MSTTTTGTLMRSDLKLPNIESVYRGKVRDVYHLTDDRTLLVANEARFNSEPGSFAHAAFRRGTATHRASRSRISAWPRT